ncbi:MAG: hypothetical protein H7A35_02965 [Planctomycetales bacterium]|nr:hypothetical protein [bacterium]UNM09018.1 MAG: hypothetical protein H7A35_02965 [Planctomycetales bacterium]
MKRHIVLSLAILLVAILPIQSARAADRDLESLGNWFGDRVDWRVSLGLPVDTEFIAPITADYNWAYGTPLLGVNVREYNTRNYYVAIAGFSDGRLDIYDSEGPMNATAELRSGRYHVTAGLPNGRLLCWLTVPGQFPIRLELSRSYLPGSGFDVVVDPPEPVSANLADWTILASYQTNVAGNNIATDVMDGNGRLLYELPGLEMDGVVRQLEYTREPVAGVDMAWMLMSVEYGEPRAGDVLRSAVGTAWFVPGQQWYTQAVRPTGRNNSSIYLDNTAGGALALMAWDSSDNYQTLSYIDRLHMRMGNTRQVITDKGIANLLSYYTTTRNWCFRRTAANRFPYVLFSDGRDLLFGYNATRRGEEGDEAGYRSFALMQGERVSDDYGNEGALYPVDGVTMSTHWSTGAPLVFYIRNGSADYPGGQLYHLQYTRPASARTGAGK